MLLPLRPERIEADPGRGHLGLQSVMGGHRLNRLLYVAHLAYRRHDAVGAHADLLQLRIDVLEVLATLGHLELQLDAVLEVRRADDRRLVVLFLGVDLRKHHF